MMFSRLALFFAATLARGQVLTIRKWSGADCTSTPSNLIIAEDIMPSTCINIPGTAFHVKATGTTIGACSYGVFNDAGCTSSLWNTATGPGGLSMGTIPILPGVCYKGTNPTDKPEMIFCGPTKTQVCPTEVNTALIAGTCNAATCPANVINAICASASCRPYLEAITANPTQRPSAYCPATINPFGFLVSKPCFPSSASVTKADGTVARIDSLKEGDAIVAATDDGTIGTDTVSLLSIAKPEAHAHFVALTTAANQTLHLTADHHLPVGATCCATLKKAKDVAVGETVWAARKGTIAATPARVTDARLVRDDAQLSGLHSPVLTSGGFPVVDGLVTSFDSYAKVALAKHGLAPLLKACKASGTCDTFRETFLSAEDKRYIDQPSA